MEIIGKYLTYTDLVKSDMAKRLGIINAPTDTQLDNLKALIEHTYDKIIDRLFSFSGSPINKFKLGFNSCFRNETLNKAVGGAKNSQHCIDMQTEILTYSGWKNYGDVNLGDLVFSVNPLSNEIEEDIVLDKIFKKHTGLMYGASNQHVNYFVTPEHRMYCRTTSSPTYTYNSAENIHNKRRVFLTASTKKNKEPLREPLLLWYKLLMSVISDGCVDFSNDRVRVSWVLKKERDKGELEYILGSLGIKYHKRYCSDREKFGQFGVYNYSLNKKESKIIAQKLGKNKEIPIEILQLPSEALFELLKTYAMFDGSFDKRDNCTGISIMSTHKKNLDTLQAMSFLCGRRSNLKYHLSNSSYGSCLLGILSTSDNIESRLNEEKELYFTKKVKEEPVWCISTINTNFICRRQGKVFVTGNCTGEAIDLDADIYGHVTNQEIFSFIKNNLEFDQLIAEGLDSKGNVGWVHVSYSKTKNRKQVLVMIKVNGKSKYFPYSETKGLVYSNYIK